MRDPDPVVFLACGHVQIDEGRCATTDCPNFINDQETIDFPMVTSILLSVAMLLWVRVRTGRGAIDIIMDALPTLPGIG